MKRMIVIAVAVAGCGIAAAKLPVPVLDDAAKAKAAETAAKTAWQGKVDNYQLCKAQDRVAAGYLKTGAKPAAAAPPPCVDPGPFALAPPAGAASAPAAAAPAPAKAASAKKS